MDSGLVRRYADAVWVGLAQKCHLHGQKMNCLALLFVVVVLVIHMLLSKWRCCICDSRWVAVDTAVVIVRSLLSSFWSFFLMVDLFTRRLFVQPTPPWMEPILTYYLCEKNNCEIGVDCGICVVWWRRWQEKRPIIPHWEKPLQKPSPELIHSLVVPNTESGVIREGISGELTMGAMWLKSVIFMVKNIITCVDVHITSKWSYSGVVDYGKSKCGGQYHCQFFLLVLSFLHVLLLLLMLCSCFILFVIVVADCWWGW